MAIEIVCACGKTYRVKDEYAGKTLKCPACHAQISVPETGAGEAGWDPAFNRDKFLLRQKAIAISEKYYVWDEQGDKILFVLRPAHPHSRTGGTSGPSVRPICPCIPELSSAPLGSSD